MLTEEEEEEEEEDIFFSFSSFGLECLSSILLSRTGTVCGEAKELEREREKLRLWCFPLLWKISLECLRRLLSKR